MTNEKKGIKGKLSSVNQAEQGDILTHDGKDAHWRGAAQDYDTENVRDAARTDEQGKKPSNVQSSISSLTKSPSDNHQHPFKK